MLVAKKVCTLVWPEVSTGALLYVYIVRRKIVDKCIVTAVTSSTSKIKTTTTKGLQEEKGVHKEKLIYVIKLKMFPIKITIQHSRIPDW